MNEAIQAEIEKLERQLAAHISERDNQITRIAIVELQLDSLRAELAKQPAK